MQTCSFKNLNCKPRFLIVYSTNVKIISQRINTYHVKISSGNFSLPLFKNSPQELHLFLQTKFKIVVCRYKKQSYWEDCGSFVHIRLFIYFQTAWQKRVLVMSFRLLLTQKGAHDTFRVQDSWVVESSETYFKNTTGIRKGDRL